jgi:hypothetical protein
VFTHPAQRWDIGKNSGTIRYLCGAWRSKALDDLLKPISNPSKIAVKWEDGTKSTFRISVTFTEIVGVKIAHAQQQRRTRELYT